MHLESVSSSWNHCNFSENHIITRNYTVYHNYAYLVILLVFSMVSSHNQHSSTSDACNIYEKSYKSLKFTRFSIQTNFYKKVLVMTAPQWIGRFFNLLKFVTVCIAFRHKIYTKFYPYFPNSTHESIFTLQIASSSFHFWPLKSCTVYIKCSASFSAAVCLLPSRRCV